MLICDVIFHLFFSLSHSFPCFNATLEELKSNLDLKNQKLRVVPNFIHEAHIFHEKSYQNATLKQQERKREGRKLKALIKNAVDAPLKL